MRAKVGERSERIVAYDPPAKVDMDVAVGGLTGEHCSKAPAPD